MTDRACMSCGQPAAWLVTMPYDMGASPEGRLLHYCEEHRAQGTQHFGVLLPLSVLDWDYNAVLKLLYGAGLTKSDPDMVQDHLGVPGGEWLSMARTLVQENE